ncbi:MAG: hypothetical protein ACX94B_13110 [Henriciella sp.]
MSIARIPASQIRFIATSVSHVGFPTREAAADVADRLTKDTGHVHKVLCVLHLSPKAIDALAQAGVSLPTEEIDHD